MRAFTNRDLFIQSLKFLVFFFPVWAIIGTLVGAWVGYMTFGKLGWITGYAVPLVLCFYSAKWYFGGFEKVWKLSEAKVLNSMAHIDYFNYGGGGGIALNVNEKNIAYVDATHTRKPKDGFIIGLTELKSIEWTQPGRTEFYANPGLVNSYQTEVNNDRELRKQAMKTGLILHLDNIDRPKIFLRMPFEEAERWGFLLQKFMEGTLESQSSPIFYPKLPLTS